MKKLSIFALAAVAALSACKKGGSEGGDTTAVGGTDTAATVAPAPVTPAPMDSTTAAPMTPAPGTTTDSMAGGMTDTTKMDTTKKM